MPKLQWQENREGLLISRGADPWCGSHRLTFHGRQQVSTDQRSIRERPERKRPNELNHCVNRLVRTGQYNSLDGGKSAMAIMAACEDQIKKEQPACFADDPKDNEVDNQKQMSPGASCRFAAVAAIQLTLKAYEGGIPLSDELAPGVVKQPENPADVKPNSAPAAEAPSSGTTQETPAPNGSPEQVEPNNNNAAATTAPVTATDGPKSLTVQG